VVVEASQDDQMESQVAVEAYQEGVASLEEAEVVVAYQDDRMENLDKNVTEIEDGKKKMRYGRKRDIVVRNNKLNVIQ
jgi:hypothetical protein